MVNLSGRQQTGRNAVDLTWHPPTTGDTATSYYVTRELFEGQTIQASSCTTSEGTTTCRATFTALGCGTHWFSVRAQNAGGRSDGVGVSVTVTDQPCSARASWARSAARRHRGQRT